MDSQPKFALSRISVLMFLQFFIWGAWFATLNLCLAGNAMGDFIEGAYGTVPMAAMIAPLALGVIADRFMPAQIMLGILFLVGGGLLFAIFQAGQSGNGGQLVWLLLAYMLTFMPTLGLGNAVAFANLDDITFPKARVWGTLGWIVAGLVVGGLAWSAQLEMFALAAGASASLGLYCFSLPSTPAPAKDQPFSWRALFMVDALKLLKIPSFAVFLICSTAICIPLAYYYGITGFYLEATGATQPASLLSIGQMSEVIFMLLIPFFFRRLGVKKMLLIGMFCWVLRYLLFSFGAEDRVIWMILAGIALHGICYDFFFVTGFIYADRVAPKEVRGQVQSLLVFLTQGVGMFVGYKFAFGGWGLGGAPANVDLAGAIGEARGDAPELTMWQKFGQMFDFNMPESVDAELLGTALGQWADVWKIPALMAVVVAVVFAIAFRGDREEKS